MNKEQQIEEMANILEQAKINALSTVGSLNRVFGMWYAEALYKAGYRKIDENSIVISNEEYENLKKGIKTYTAMFDRGQEERIRQLTERLNYASEQSTEVLKEFAEKLKKCTRCDNFFTDGKWHRYIFIEAIDELLKEYEE